MKYVLTYGFQSGASYINEPGMAGWYPTYDTRREEFTSEAEMRARYAKIKDEKGYHGFRMEVSHELPLTSQPKHL